MDSTSLLLLTLFLFYFVWKLSTIASRLDRTHRRRDAALISLRRYLAIRATATAKLITSGSLETNVAARLRSDLENVMNESEKSFNAYLIAESKLTGALCEEFDDDNQILPLLGSTKTADLVFELVRASKRVQLARRFHNDAVGASQLLHKRFVVRLFRLAGHTPAPKAVDLDDRVPASFQNL